jgi:hypothetical protein
MAGFGIGPVGSLPTGSTQAGTGVSYQITSGKINYKGGLLGSTMVISGPRATWVGAEVLHTGAAKARLTTIAAEVMHTGSAKARLSALAVEVLRSLTTQIMPVAAQIQYKGATPGLQINISQPRVTWMGTEVVHTGAAQARLSAMGAEVLHTGAAKARLSAMAVEVLRSAADYFAPPRVTWFAAEVVHTGAAQARLSNVAAEVLHVGAAKARLSAMGVEVLRSVKNAVSGGGFVSIIWG